MSAPPVDFTASTSASGYEDGFGRRAIAFDREDGSMRERLYLRPEFSIYHQALREAFAQLAAAADPRLMAPRVLERDSATGELVAISDFAGGERLADLLEAAADHARDEGVVPGIEVALGFLLAVLPALDALRSTTGLPHGALAPSRCILTPDGSVILTECGFAAVLQRLNLSRQRLWREFRIAVPPVAGAARFDPTSDVAQAALAAVMLVLGRPMQDGDDPADTLPDFLAEVIEIAQIRSNVTFAVNLQRFLQRALPLPGRRPYQTIDAALQDVRHLASGIGFELCRTSLADLVRGTIGAPAGVLVSTDERDDAPAAAALETSAVEPAAIDTVAFEPAVFESAPEPPGEELDIVLAPHFEEPPTPVIEAIAAAEFEDVPADAWPPPAIVDEPQARIIEEFRSALADKPGPAFETSETPEMSASGDGERADEPLPDVVYQPPPARRRRSRSRRNDDDALRSSVAPAAPLPPPPIDDAERTPEPVRAELAPLVTREPLVVAPAPIAVAPEPIVRQPVFSPPVPASLPVFAPLPIAAGETLWEGPPPIAPPVPIASRPAASAHVGLAPVRLKSDPNGFQARAPRYEPRDYSVGYVDPRRGREPVGGRGVSWKFAVAAVAIMVTVIAAGRAYLPDSETLNAEAKRGPAPVTVAAPPPVSTGTIVVRTQPAGARVLLDGSPAGETPLRIVDVAPGKHVLTFITPAATIKRTVKVEADNILTLDVPVFSGWVAIFAPILLEVSQEGRALGTTEQGRLMLPPGRHTLTLTNREFGYSASHAVEIEAGEVRSLNIQPTGTVNLNAVPWAEVWVDGRKVGETPLANLELPLGNREIIFRHPGFGERRLMTAVTAGAPAALSVDFSK